MAAVPQNMHKLCLKFSSLNVQVQLMDAIIYWNVCIRIKRTTRLL